MEAIMAAAAFQTQFRQEIVKGFEQGESLVRTAVTTEAVIKGNQATFLVADTGGATAVTRGINGRIPSRNLNLVQKTATLEEWHDKPTVSGFNIFASQGDLRMVMRDGVVKVINRKLDEQVLTTLATGTVHTGTAAKASVSMVMRSLTILGNSDVPYDGQIFGIISPAFHAYIQQTPEFASADYVNGKPFENGIPLQRPMLIWWNNVYWIVHPNLSGKGTAAEKCFLFHRSAIGHAINTGDMQIVAGYDEEDDYSFARCTAFMGAVPLQNSGVVVMNHDGSEYVAA